MFQNSLQNWNDDFNRKTIQKDACVENDDTSDYFDVSIQ